MILKTLKIYLIFKNKNTLLPLLKERFSRLNFLELKSLSLHKKKHGCMFKIKNTLIEYNQVLAKK